MDQEEYLSLLDDDRLIHWFCQNFTSSHPKVTNLPIGLNYHTMKSEPSVRTREHITYQNWGKKTDPSDQENLMHGWAILQACSLDQGRPSIRVLRSINSDIAQGHGGVPVDCFQPRHAVRFQSEDAVKEYLICFQCHNWCECSIALPAILI